MRDRDALARLIFETWQLQGGNVYGDHVDWPEMNQSQRLTWCLMADAAKAAVLSDLATEGRLVEAGYLAALERLANAHDAYDRAEQALVYREPGSQRRCEDAQWERYRALTALREHPAWRDQGRAGQEGQG